jgi:hypothetical protein
MTRTKSCAYNLLPYNVIFCGPARMAAGNALTLQNGVLDNAMPFAALGDVGGAEFAGRKICLNSAAKWPCRPMQGRRMDKCGALLLFFRV